MASNTVKLSEEELSYWLTFDRLKVGLGKKRVYSLYEHFGTLKEAWHADKHSLNEVKGIPEKAIDKFLATRDSYSLEESLKLLYKHNIQAVTCIESEYPEQCKALKDSPLILYINGYWDKSWYDKAIGIVGTREVTDYGEAMTKSLSMRLAEENVTIVTGIARGVDLASLQSANLVENSRMVAVVAHGVDKIVPYSSRLMYKVLRERGAIISEYPPETMPEKGFFPARNRIIAALSNATLVVEAGEKSGALITADKAREMGKKVFACAGHPQNTQNQGNHLWLRKQQAQLITSAEDILEEMNWSNEFSPGTYHVENVTDLTVTDQPIQPTAQVNLQPVQDNSLLVKELDETSQQVYKQVQEHKRVTLDKIVEFTGLPINKVSSSILKLTLKKLIATQEGYIILK